LPPARQKILDGLAWLETIGTALADKTALAHVVGVSSTSGGYFNNLGALRAAGLIDYPEPSMVVLTEEGRAQATAPDAPLTHEAIMALVAQRLPPAQVKILDAVAMAYPKEVEKTELAAKVGVSPTSGGYFNNLGRLRTLGLITYPRPNAARADDRLFP
jgi:Mn-dependent DtxR family transcriptional regulator